MHCHQNVTLEILAVILLALDAELKNSREGLKVILRLVPILQCMGRVMDRTVDLRERTKS